MIFALMFGASSVVVAAEKAADPATSKTGPRQTPPASTPPAAKQKGCDLQESKACCTTNGFKWSCAWKSGPVDDEGHGGEMVLKCWCHS